MQYRAMPRNCRRLLGLADPMDASQILPNLFVGSCPTSPKDIGRLKRNGITAVLSVQTEDDLANWGVDWEVLKTHYDQAGIEIRRVPSEGVAQMR